MVLKIMLRYKILHRIIGLIQRQNLKQELTCVDY